MKRTLLIITAMLCASVIQLAGCAAGSATAGYAMRAGSADTLKPEAEDRIVEKILRRVREWHEIQHK